jgi:transcription initiation factor IIE alpha subunit
MQSPHNNISSRQPFSLAPKSDTSTIFFPHWVECPYRFHVRLVWAALMDSARRKRAASSCKIEKLTGLSDNTIRLAIRTLVKDNLCAIQKGEKRITGTDLLEPADDAKYWAPKAGEGWLNQVAYTVVTFSTGLSAIQAVLLAKAATLKGRQSYQGLSAMLGTCKSSVRKALNALIALRVINLTKLPGGYFILDVADIDPSIKSKEADSPVVNKFAPDSATHDVADIDPERRKATKKMSQILHRDVADIDPDVADVSRDVADIDPSIMCITGIKELIEEKEVVLGGEEEERAEQERGLRAINRQLLTLQCAKETRIKVMKLVDRLFSKRTENGYLGQFSLHSRYVCEDVAKWFERYYAYLSEEHKKRKYTGKPISLVIHRLEIALGDKPKPTPAPKPKKVLTGDEQYARACEREFQAALQEERELCIDFSIPNVPESKGRCFTRA